MGARVDRIMVCQQAERRQTGLPEGTHLHDIVGAGVDHIEVASFPGQVRLCLVAHFTTAPEEGKLFTITFELVGLDVDHRQQINSGGSIQFTDMLPGDPPDFPRTDLATFTAFPEVPKAGIYRVVAAVDGTEAETTVRILERPAAG